MVLSTVGKAHQRIIRELKETSKNNQGAFWGSPVNPILAHSEVKQIDFITASKIILEYEWIGTMPLPKSCRYMYGIYFEGILGGAIVYVEPSTRQFNSKYPRRIVQLNRGAVEYWTPKNTNSRLIGKSFDYLRKENVLAIMAYCTKEAGEVGTIYQSCNFMYTGETQPSKTYFLDNHWVSERTLADKTAWAKGRGERWENKFKNLPVKTLSGKYRYIYLLGSRKENREFIEEYGFQSFPYPKRNAE